jgi:hypothetical protein
MAFCLRWEGGAGAALAGKDTTEIATGQSKSTE